MSLILLGRYYADVRVYRGGLPTRQGLPLHFDLLPAVIEALQDALRRASSEPGRVAGRRATRDERMAAAQATPSELGAAAGAGRTGVAGSWDEVGGWGAWR